jgi:thiol-disulfide isomerase/thioredoxin
MNGEQIRSWLMFGGAVAVIAWVFSHRFDHGALVDKPAPDFALAVAAGEGAEQGDRLRLSDLKGKVVVLDFWASWCGPCQASVPDLSALANQYGDRGVRFLGINGESLPAPFYPQIASAWGFAYPLLRDPQNAVHRSYQVQAFPSLFVIDRTQTVRYAVAGVPPKSRVEREILNALK